MKISRRSFLKTAQTVGLGFIGLAGLPRSFAHTNNAGLPLVVDPHDIIDLPEGFSYSVVSMTGEAMADKFFRPGRPDGMACFPHPVSAHKCILMCNHENWPDTENDSPFGPDNALLSRLDPSMLYDKKPNGQPFIGGVTKMVYNLESKKLEQDFLALAGTTGNCAGGQTPWGSWLSCEESSITCSDGALKPHGFVFEIPSQTSKMVRPVPLTAMGRFAHEAAAVDPETGAVYLTEDNRNGLVYRFLPAQRANLKKGGRLQALAIKGLPSTNTSNWAKDWGGNGADSFPVGQSFDVDWVDLDNVTAPDGDLALRGYQKGAAQFCRGEGMVYGIIPGSTQGAIFFNCTQGGAAHTGQVWRYIPSYKEGFQGELPGKLTLIYESQSADNLDLCDNLAIAPWGDLILCEDGLGDQYLRGLTPQGKLYDIAKNAHAEKSEFCGACFSPNGDILFVNIQEPGITLALEGPWNTLREGDAG